MRRFFISNLAGNVGDLVELPAVLIRHLHTVLRLSAGEQIQLFNGRGQQVRVSLQQNFTAEILQIRQAEPPQLALTLIQGIAKGEKLELVLQKGTELGVGSFILAQMERSVGRMKPERQAKRLQRWQKIIQEAARQCGQPWLPQLEVGASFAGTVSTNDAELKLLLWEESAQPLVKLLPEQAPKSISIVVGPEGGISGREAEIARSAGYRPVRLGPRILRTETAGLAIVSILQYLYGDLADIQTGSQTICEGKDRS
jgi:16S rRNA (uracil1498-N3)-methyltransferase